MFLSRLNRLKTKRPLFLVFSAVSLLSILYLFSIGGVTPPKSGPRFPSPTPAPPFQVLNAYPPGGLFGPLDPQSSLVFQLNRPVAPHEYRVEINPAIKTIVGFSLQDDKTLYVRPLEDWKLDQPYEIKLIGALEKIVFQYQVTFVPPSPEEEDLNSETYTNP